MVFPTTNGSRASLSNSCRRGFTFVELMVVMAIIAMLLTIALPRYFDGLQRSKEAILREDLATMRDAIGHYYGDKGSYPPSLEALVEQHYLRFIPEDPITNSNETWEVVPLPDNTLGVYDLHSGSQEAAKDGTAYASW
jgi:general secretion pathway protein G